MVFTVKINDVDYTPKAISAKWDLKISAIEALELEIFQPDPADVDTGKEVILYRDTTPVFEGIIYEKHLEYSEGAPEYIRYARVRALSKLVLYDNYIVTRSYTTGTTAGSIISDIASVIDGVDTTNVEDGPQLQQDWNIPNRKALDVLTDIAKATDYLLFMRPGLKLYYKQKNVGEPEAIFDTSNTIYVENNEDNWNFKNRILYYGKDNQLLADVSEGDGDRPLVISDPFLEDAEEAERRATTWLNRLQYAKREIRLVVEKQLAEALDVGSTITINFPNLGINSQNVFVTGIEYPFDVKELYATIICGGELEYFELLLEELKGRDPTALFGSGGRIEDLISSVVASVTSLTNTQRIQSVGKTVRIYNIPPLTYENGVNVVLDDDGTIKLASGYLSGSFEFSWLPQSELFTRWLRTQYVADLNDGSISAKILLPDGTVLFNNVSDDFDIPHLPPSRGAITQDISEWELTNATVEELQTGIIGITSLRFTNTATSMTLVWPKTKDANLDILRILRFYFYTFNDASITIKLYQDENNYLSGTINNVGGSWQRVDIFTSTMTRTGDPRKMNWLEITTTARILFLDSDYLMFPAGRERLRLKINLSRPTLTSVSPKVKIVKFVWREGKT
jgi:hypothetical protein